MDDTAYARRDSSLRFENNREREQSKLKTLTPDHDKPRIELFLASIYTSFSASLESQVFFESAMDCLCDAFHLSVGVDYHVRLPETATNDYGDGFVGRVYGSRGQ